VCCFSDYLSLVTLIVYEGRHFTSVHCFDVTQASAMHSMALSGASSVCFSQGGQQQQKQQ
jgi:hypothetical protein